MQGKVKGVWLTVLFSTAFNIAGTYVAFVKPDLSLDLNMIGTFIASVVLGPLWGMGTGILTHLITSCRHDYLLFSTPVNVSGGMYWGTIAQLGCLPLLRNPNSQLPETDSEVIYRTALVIIVLGVLGGAVTSVPSSFLQENIFNRSGFPHAAGNSGSYHPLFAEMSQSVPDKILAAVAGIIITFFFFRLRAVRLTETYCHTRDIGKCFFDAFVYDIKGLLFFGALAALYVARLFNSGGPISAGLLLGEPSVFLPLLWFVPIPIAGGIARCFVEKRQEPIVPMMNKDLVAPNMKLCIMVLTGVVYWFIFWSAKMGRPEHQAVAAGSPHTDVFLLTALLLLIMILLLQDWRSSHVEASIRETAIRKEIRQLEADRESLASEVTTLHRNLEEWKLSLEEAQLDSGQAKALAEELFDELTKQFEQHKKIIAEKDEDLKQKQALLDRLPGNSMVADDRYETTSGKRESMLLKILFPYLTFHNRAVKEVSKGIGHDNIKKRTVTGILHMLNEGKSLPELCDRYECNEMLEARKGSIKTYRLKEGRCRVYFYLPPSNCDAVKAEIISVIYDKNTRRIPDHVKEATPSWS